MDFLFAERDSHAETADACRRLVESGCSRGCAPYEALTEAKQGLDKLPEKVNERPKAGPQVVKTLDEAGRSNLRLGTAVADF
jgi:hypothetical protein